jgi:hypothetical protein
MSNDFEIDLVGVAQAQARYGPNAVAVPLRRLFTRIVIFGEGQAKLYAPVDTGRLRASLTHEVDQAEVPMYATFGTNVSYAAAMEYGTGRMYDGPGAHAARHWPPSGPLETWARRHGIEGEGKETGGEVVARRIGYRGGLKPRRYIRRALTDTLPKVKMWVEKMGQEITAMLEG